LGVEQQIRQKAEGEGVAEMSVLGVVYYDHQALWYSAVHCQQEAQQKPDSL
jgi:hypothetical protein